MNKALFAQAVVATLQDDFKGAKVSKGKHWYTNDNMIYATKIEESDTGCLQAYSRDRSEGETTYQKVVLSNGGHMIEMAAESEKNPNNAYKKSRRWENLKDAFLLKSVDAEGEHDSPIWSQRLTHEGGNMGDFQMQQGSEVGKDGSTVVRRLQRSSKQYKDMLAGLRGYTNGDRQILEVYRILRTKRDRLVITQVRREPTFNQKDHQVYVIEGSFSYADALKNKKFNKINTKPFKYNQQERGGNKFNTFQFCFGKYCRAIIYEVKRGVLYSRQVVDEEGSNGPVDQRRETGKKHLTWYQKNENVAKKVDFETLDKECSTGTSHAGWKDDVQITECKELGIVKVKDGDFVYIVKDKDGKLEEAASANVALAFGKGNGEAVAFKNNGSNPESTGSDGVTLVKNSNAQSGENSNAGIATLILAATIV